VRVAGDQRFHRGRNDVVRGVVQLHVGDRAHCARGPMILRDDARNLKEVELYCLDMYNRVYNAY
jgi:hypothetical protein